MNVTLACLDAITTTPGLTCITPSMSLMCQLVIVDGAVVGIRFGDEGRYFVQNEYTIRFAYHDNAINAANGIPTEWCNPAWLRPDGSV